MTDTIRTIPLVQSPQPCHVDGGANVSKPTGTADLDLDALEALAAKATAGEWHIRPHGTTAGTAYVDTPHDGLADYGGSFSVADAAFIAAAREAVPALIARVRELEAENADLRAKVAEAHAATHCDCGNELSRGKCHPCDNDE